MRMSHPPKCICVAFVFRTLCFFTFSHLIETGTNRTLSFSQPKTSCNQCSRSFLTCVKATGYLKKEQALQNVLPWLSVSIGHTSTQKNTCQTISWKHYWFICSSVICSWGLYKGVQRVIVPERGVGTVCDSVRFSLLRTRNRAEGWKTNTI